jgi:peptidoglycan/xylan/chitin deacetylase (PgdA/CDA1 family)
MFHNYRVAGQGHALFALFLLIAGVILPLLSAFFTPEETPVGMGVLPTARVIVPTTDHRPPTTDHRPPTTDRPLDVVQDGRPPAIVIRQAPAETPAAVPTATSVVATTRVPEHKWATPTITPVPLPAVGAASAQAPAPVATLIPAPTITPVPLPAVGAAGAQAPVSVPGAPVPILMYHYIRAVDQASDPMGYELSVEPALFEQQIAWLHAQGYASIRMDTLAGCLRGAADCPPQAVALTFDDGYEDAFTNALPVLRRYGYTATFYIISGLVGQPGYMTWDQLAALWDAGMEIGAHTIDHLDLTTLDTYEAERQIAQSKADLERGLGISVVSFCYPGGIYSAGLMEQVRAAGFLSATTTRWDADYSDMVALPRRRISGGTAAESFAWIMQ